jgi:hypothetical protein
MVKNTTTKSMIFSEDPTETWCYSRDRYHKLIGDHKLADTFIDVATSALQCEREYLLDDLCEDLNNYNTKRLRLLKPPELAKLLGLTILALKRPGFKCESLLMEEILYITLHNDLVTYLDGIRSGRRKWGTLLRAMACDDLYILNDLFWDFDFELFEPTKEETRALRKELASL